VNWRLVAILKEYFNAELRLVISTPHTQQRQASGGYYS